MKDHFSTRKEPKLQLISQSYSLKEIFIILLVIKISKIRRKCLYLFFSGHKTRFSLAARLDSSIIPVARFNSFPATRFNTLLVARLDVLLVSRLDYLQVARLVSLQVSKFVFPSLQYSILFELQISIFVWSQDPILLYKTRFFSLRK